MFVCWQTSIAIFMPMRNTYYITTPIYYINDVPHIGHAYTNIVSDVMARYMRLSGKDVKFLTGTDEHGQKIERAAKAANKNPQDFADDVSVVFRNLCDVLHISNDDFIRTTEDRHKITVRRIWEQLYQNGDIYLGKYSGWYAVRDEAFYDEGELVDGKAPTGALVEWVEEDSYFFALSKYTEKLLHLYSRNTEFIKPRHRYNEVVSFVRRGLKDIAISRTTFQWGIKVPNISHEGGVSHVIYVWLDALTNYLSAVDYYNADKKPDISELVIDGGLDSQAQSGAINVSGNLRRFWPADLHVVGKDILRFHAVYWPAFLMSADIELPKCIVAHGWWMNEGHKISKSLGNVIDPVALVNEFGIDPVRYFLLREMSFGQDGNFARQSLIARNNNELCNKLGNLVHRVLVFICNNTNAQVPHIQDIGEIYNSDLIQYAIATREKVKAFMQSLELTYALSSVFDLIDHANAYIDTSAPWKLKNLDINMMNVVLYVLVEAIRYIAILLIPFIPVSANKILDLLCVPQNERMLNKLESSCALSSYHSVVKNPEPLFKNIIIKDVT